jgi:GAF domain-containing protein
VEEENRQFVERYLEIEEENNNLANLYVASYQLHSTLDLDEVLKIIIEIVINLIGAEIFAVYLFDGNSQDMAVAASEGLPPTAFPKCSLGSGPLGKAVAATETTCWDTARSDDLRQPIVCIPLAIQKRPIGAIAIYSLLQQKNGFTALDHELFTLLGGHAATAIFAARLYSQSERKLNTIQGFIDLLTK